MSEKLMKYQELDGKIKKIISELNKTNEVITNKKLTNFLKDAEENLKKMETKAKDINGQMLKLGEKYSEGIKTVGELQSGVDKAIDKEELRYILKKIGDVGKSIAVVEREMLTLQKETDEILTKYDALRTQVPIAQKQYGESKIKVSELRKEKEPEIAKLKKELESMEKGIDQKTLEKYKQLKSQNIFPVYVMVTSGGKCGGCQMDFSSGTINQLTDNNFIICETCGRMVSK